MEGIDDMRFINASYNSNYNSIDITTFDKVLLRIDCNKAEEGIRTTPGSQCALNALAIDEPLEYARLALVLFFKFSYATIFKLFSARKEVLLNYMHNRASHLCNLFFALVFI